MDLPQPVVRTFGYELKRIESRLLIEIKCSVCREKAVVSKADESLERWEDSHRRNCHPSASDDDVICLAAFPSLRLLH
jgi:hypothetical protein